MDWRNGVLLWSTVILWMLLPLVSSQDKDADENRPYKFGYTIDQHHHRKEEKDENGIIKGEFGFITADGWYLTTVYRTDENGDFHIVSRKRTRVGPAVERHDATPGPFKTATKPTTTTSTTTTRKPPPKININGGGSCSHCSIPSTTSRPEEAPKGPVGRPPATSITGSLPPGSTRPRAGPPRPGERPGAGPPRPGARPGAGSSRPGARPGAGPGARPGSSPTRPGAIPGTSPPQRATSPPQRATSPPRPGKVPGTSRPRPTPERQPGAPDTGKLDRNRTYDEDERLYKFNYTVGFHGHHETGYRDGAKVGDYFWNNRDGRGQRVVYDANEFGFQPNISFVDLTPEETPREETEKEFGLKGYEFKWFYPLPDDNGHNRK